MADKRYVYTKNRKLLKEKERKYQILKKAVRGKALKVWRQNVNSLIFKFRHKVEPTFGSIRLWFPSEKTRYRVMAKSHAKQLMETFACNQHRSFGIIVFGREH